MTYLIGTMQDGKFVPFDKRYEIDYDSTPKVDPLADAIHWATRNATAFEQCITWAREDQAHGARPSIKLYFELLRRPWMAEKLGMQRTSVQFLLNNNLHSQVARLINRECPDIHFPTREAKSDSYRT